MLADPLALVGPIHQLVQVLSSQTVVPEPVRDVMRPVAAGLDVAEQVSPQLMRLLDTGWDAVSALGAGESITAVGRTVTALTDSAVHIGRVTAAAAEIVIRGTVEVIALAEQFLARAAALGPALLTPPGQIALVGLASEHLTRGLQIVDRVRSELEGPTAELRAIAASIPDAPGAPGSLSAGSAGSAASGTAVGPAVGSAAGPTVGSAIASRGATGDAGHFDPGSSGSSSGSSGAVGGGVQITLPDGSMATAPNEKAADAVRSALTQQGVPYVWGGTSPGQGLDCSGLTQWAYKEAGVDLPRLAQEQNIGAPVSQTDLMPGDLAVWDGHVAMCIGNGQLVEAGDPVSVSPVRTDNSGMNFYGFFRPTTS